MKITFWGAAQTVTGSMHLVESVGKRLLLDCGTYQGRRQEARERNSRLPFKAGDIDAVLLSHAHIDHSGNLPTLVKNGYAGSIWASPATADLCGPMLLDSAYIQEKDAEFINRRSARRRSLPGADGRQEDVQPIYTTEDAEASLKQFQKTLLHSPTELWDGLIFETFDAGHMLGSTTILMDEDSRGGRTRLVFSGDVGRTNLPIIPDPEPCPPADYLIMESTYGDRLHKSNELVEDKLAAVVTRTAERGGKIVVPAFAVGRTQQLIYTLHNIVLRKRMPRIPVYVDSPLAVKTTEVFQAHRDAYDAEARALGRRGLDPFEFQGLYYIQDVQESKALNDLKMPFIVISASGMCEAGRILHHLRNTVEDPRNTVLITGFQAEHTLGRKILEGHQEIPIFGDPFRLRAEVVRLNELSGHADQSELLQWLEPAASTLKRIFLVHGEPRQQGPLADAIEQKYKIPVTIPKRGESYNL
jgi:metallo-beta-lactamase family protein